MWKIYFNNFVIFIENKLYKNTFNFDGLILRDKTNQVPLISRSLIRNKLYEVGELEAIKKLKLHDDNFLDLGSSIGITTLAISRLAENKKIISVEPVIDFLNYSKNNIELYGNKSNDYKYLNKAIYYGEKIPKIIKKQNSLEGTISESKGQNIEKTTINKIINNYELSSFNILIDLEGYSFEPFINEPLVFERCNKLVVEESFSEEFKREEFITTLKNLGFHIAYENIFWNSTVIGATKN